MNTSLERLLDLLDSKLDKINQYGAGHTRLNGWNFAALTPGDLARFTSEIADELRQGPTDNLEADSITRIDRAVEILQGMPDSVISHMFNGHAAQAIPAYLLTMMRVRNDLLPVLGWQKIIPGTIPPKLAKRIRSFEAELDQITPNKAELSKRIKLINDATEASEALPTTLADLERATAALTKHETEALLASGRIANFEKDATNKLGELLLSAESIKKLEEQIEEAYRITTTKGLAAAFDQRHTSLSRSMWIWVGVLFIALAAGFILGSNQIGTIMAYLKIPSGQTVEKAPNALLALFSFGAPIWLAWVATKQISQRFRLAEDYAFKASVAKAYEGYRKEAARLDVELEMRLFQSALARLEEAPLRLVESKTPGSPWHEFVESDAFIEALHAVPALKEQFKKLKRKSTPRPSNETAAEEKND